MDALAGQYFQRLLDDRQGAQAQKVHFQQAQLLYDAHGILCRNDIVIGLQGHIIGRGPARDQDTCRVGARVTWHTLQQQGCVDQTLDPLVGIVAVFQIRVDAHRPIQCNVQLPRDHLGDLVGLLVSVAKHAADIAHHAPGSHGAEGDDLRHMVAAVLAGYIVDHFLAALIAKININIRHGDALGV